MAKTNGGWDREQVTIRLTRARKDLLMTLAANESICGSPCDAIDRALEVAVNGGTSARDTAERIASLEDAIAAADSARSDDAARFEAALTRMAENLSNLHALIASLAGSEG
jgi:hypothetical protein